MNIIPISFLQQPIVYSASTPGTGSMRTLLSAAGQRAYDSGHYFTQYPVKIPREVLTSKKFWRD